MNYLLDTHIAIWAIIDRKKLSKELIRIIENLDNKIYVSLISVWEVAIKNAKYGDVKMPIDEIKFLKYCSEMEFDILPIKASHISNLRNLKVKDENIVHKDPFDRMIVSQSLCENLTLITQDRLVLNYVSSASTIR